jgi:hypothetical protein
MDVILKHVPDGDIGNLIKLRVDDVVFEFCTDSREIIDIWCEKKSGPIETLKNCGVMSYDDTSRMAVYFLTLAGVLGYNMGGMVSEAEKLIEIASQRAESK